MKWALPLFILITLVSSCGPTPGPTYTPAPPQPVQLSGGGFALYQPIPVDVRPAASTNP